LAKACREAGVDKIVFSSTAAVYGDATDSLLKETTSPHPLNPYGWSKLMSEQILQDFEKVGGARTVILRYFNVAGAAEDGSNGQRTLNAIHIVKVALEAALGLREAVTIFGGDYNTPDGTGVRDYIHISDLADAHVLALKYLGEGKRGDIFNCGYGRGYSVKQVIEAVKKVTGKEFKVTSKGRRAGDPASTIADSAKIKKILGWSPKRDSLEIICKTAYDWEVKQAGK
jgi:UDP-glucose 4-epimerase